MWTSIASLMFFWAIIKQLFPGQLGPFLRILFHKTFANFNPYVEIKFYEHSRDSFDRGTAYAAIQRYLAEKCSGTAKRLTANSIRDSKALVLSLDDYEEVVDEYQGIKVWWASSLTVSKGQTISLYPRQDERRFYTLTFNQKYRDVITNEYLNHVLDEGKAIAVKNRRSKLYTNAKQEQYSALWTHVGFQHPATFETLALEPNMKKDIVDDLITFSNKKEYYMKIGKPWKRGYLLYGPPGTGKSTMIAAMANLLQYDVYDLELTCVENNTELRKLLIHTSGKSIIVIEDIDCCLDLTGKRKKKEKNEEIKDEKEEFKKAVANEGKNTDSSKVTLSGLLNFIDGLWSACGGERIFVFTSNHLDKLDPALIRRGRMDKHIRMSYCSFEVFKELANNYLNIKSHELYGRIEKLFGEITDMTPADVVENLMPKSDKADVEHCLNSLIRALETKAKIAAELAERLRAKRAEKEEERLKAEKELKMKEVGGEKSVEETPTS